MNGPFGSVLSNDTNAVSPLRWSVPSCRLRKQRPAATPSRPSFAPQDKVSLPVSSSVPSRSRDELLFNWSVPSVRRAGRRHRQNRYDR